MSLKKTILIFIDWYLPGYKAGGPVRSIVNMVDHLSQEYDFFIVTRDREYLETIPYESVKSNCWSELNNGVHVYYTSASNERYRVWKEILQSRNWDCVYINGIYSLKYSLLPLWAAKMSKCNQIIIAPRGMVAASAINVKRGKKKIFLLLVKLFGFFKNVRWHATESKELNDIKNIFGDKAICITAPNLSRKIDFSYKETPKIANNLNLCSFARISPEKNTLYAIQLLKNTTRQYSITLDLYGQIYDHAYWNRCLEEIKSVEGNVVINYKGVVASEEVSRVMRNYHALLLPTRGENFGHVILESFMASRPVIISDQTPWKDLNDKRAGWDIDLSNVNEFRKAIELMCKMQQDEFNSYCQSAFMVAELYVNDRSVIDSYHELFCLNNS